jgi:putative ABC transport system permease protein
LRQFGGITQVRERFREREGLPWLENLRRDAGYALRQMRKSPGFAAVVIVTLALGIGATTAMFTLVYSTLLRALPFPHADRILAIHDARIQGLSTGGLVSVPRFYDLESRNRSFQSLGFFFFDQSTMIAGKDLPVSVVAAGTNAGFWSVLGARPLIGRTYDEHDDQPKMPGTAVLSYAGWQKLFGGSAAVIGRQIMLDGIPVTIVGVMPPGVDAPSGIDLWNAAQFSPADWTKYRGEGTRFINVVGRLQPGIAQSMAQTDLARVGEQLQREYPGSDGMWAFTSETLRENRYGAMRPALLVLMGASALLLLIACINVANLLLSRATARRRDVAVRTALGASAGRVAMQFLTESAVLGAVGGAVGIASAYALVRIAAAKLPGRLGMPGAVEMNWPVVAVALLLTLGTAIAFGVAPVFESRRVGMNAAIRQGEARLGGSGNGVRSVLVAVQVGLSLILLVGASLLASSLWLLVKSPLGFEPEHVLTFSLRLPWNAKPAEIQNFFTAVQQKLAAQPGVQAVGQMDALPTVDWHLRSNFDADWLPRTAGKPAINAEDRNIGGNFLGALLTPLLAGRAFNDQDSRAASIPVLVNQELVREYLPGGNPLGRHLLVEGAPHEIVGVLADVRGTAGSIASAPGPEVYWPADGNAVPGRYFLIRTHVDPQSLVQAVREQIHDVDSRQAIGDVATMDDLLNKAVAQPRLNISIVASFAGIALLLACVGIYGVVAYFVTQRTREIGVRMALGATRSGIALLFIRSALAPALAGALAGLGSALVLAQLLRSQLYGVGPTDLRAYIASALILLVPVALATLRPALQAARVDPAQTLHTE